MKTLIKLGVLAVIIFLIVRKIDERMLLRLMGSVNPLWILWALCWFGLSKFIAALRFNTLLRSDGIHLSTLQNVKLYWLCMYYNLLLPGGISGDGYKIKVLMDQFQRPFKRLLTITLIDRISGMMALGQIGLVLMYFVDFAQPYRIWILPAFMISLVIIWFLYRTFHLQKVWWINTFQSIGVQGAQAIATMGLVITLDQFIHWADYLILFLVSSLVAMVPMTIGGAGAREITFLFGSKYLNIDPEKAVAIAFLFYLVSTFVSFLGIIFSLKTNPLQQSVDK
ncbi:MAG TPA: lysylphosphatidylglycerol synthase transmembrane domain-containing protein [Saprospiraceae bacterium]|nr:lysylphosphatidylglycerol synthase transmembrane domain-containing protein [Saprospiraceae bacterium]